VISGVDHPALRLRRRRRLHGTGRHPHPGDLGDHDDQPERSHVEVDLKVASLGTGNPDRDGHLRSADFFDADKYPTITFRSTNLEPALRAPGR
jgi:hypothetical protein